ncbi:ribonuclease HII [Christensenellaceae bacterium OttesenSCG-928-K19]|nr:ribonuclease HII [Christensenellaceae bacterium OttesenSCG-928-K19]
MKETREEKLKRRLMEMTEYEKPHWGADEHVAGIDEAGRGPLAGPVVAACVVMPPDDLILGVDDSKKISEKKREMLYDIITEKALDYAVCIIDERVIDEINILNAARRAFLGALNGLTLTPHHVYTDAMELETDFPCTAVVKGDAKIYTIAAASIIAKVTRDRIMAEFDKEYPEYHFAKHKGYGTKAHYEALEKYGVLPIHRKTFLKKILER